MKFIHSSDLQIGKAFGYFEPEIASALQDARQAVVRTLGEAAVKSGATSVLISGDIYEKQQMSQQTLARAIENMRSFNSVQWHLMPGNHDHFRENGLWDRFVRMQFPSNVTLHTQPGQSRSWTKGALPSFFCPRPLHFTASVDDLTAYMDKDATPEGAIRIGMAHGSIQGFGSEGEASNYVAPNRADSAGLVCGDSASLQGDERDIVFISMIADRTRKQSQTSIQYQQRFNVALSRARDRIVLVRSVKEEELNPKDLKSKVIAHFREPMPNLVNPSLDTH